jgi:hypothetical protein
VTASSESERGAVLVISAVVMTAFVGVLALVIDIGALRYDRRTDRAATDAAATAGASLLTGKAGSALAACDAALSYALTNLHLTSSAPPSPCGGTFPANGLCDPSQEQTVTSSVGAYQITVTTPVLDSDSALMNADGVGGAFSQPVVASSDGAACDRLAVRVSYDRPSLFGGALGVNHGRTVVHSVARFSPLDGASPTYPGLVALEPHGCAAVAATPAQIIAANDGNRPGLIVADSDGTTCSSGSVIETQGSGSITALDGAGGASGELQYVAPLTTAFGGGSISGSRLLRTDPLTRLPVDSRFHCSITPKGCLSGETDPLADIMSRYSSGTPSFPGVSTTFPGPTQSCANPPSTFAAGNWYINCSTFSVTNTIQFGGGTLVFNGGIAIGAGGSLLVNATMAGGSPYVDGSGLAIPMDPSLDTTLVVRGGINVQSATATIAFAQTFMYQVGGGFGLDLQSSPTISWSSPDHGALRGLMAWNESGVDWSLQGNPTFNGRGTLFLPNSDFHAQGTADLNGVQLWARTATAQGASSRIMVRPDSRYSVAASGIGTRLIR